MAARGEKTPAVPAAASAGREGDGHPHHPVAEARTVVLHPDLGSSDESSHGREAGEGPLEAAVPDVGDQPVDAVPPGDRVGSSPAGQSHERSSLILSRNSVVAMVALCGCPDRNAFRKPFACS